MSAPRRAASKVRSGRAFLAALAADRRRGRKIVFTNGCFDILHVGHLRYLERARALGGALVVGLNTDASVRRLKGPGRPVNGQRDRAEVLAGLECVDHVTFFAEDTPLRLIRSVRPDFLVKGGDWKKRDIVGWDFVESIGGRVRSLPFVPGRSTTSTLRKIRSRG
jgi:D-beta-D-heptose 7-phosphate kinase/D-beta-D-heptose 1-phosphate adenosyltransferase